MTLSCDFFSVIRALVRAGLASNPKEHIDCQVVGSLASSSSCFLICFAHKINLINKQHNNNTMSETMTTTTTETMDLKQTTKPADEKMVTSGVTGAVIGFLFGGPLLSAFLGFGAAYASQKNDAVGRHARSLGDFGVSVRDKAIEIDEKHQVRERSSKVASDAWQSAKECDEKHNILETTKDTAVSTWQWLVAYIRENRLMERGVEVTGRGYEYAAERLGGGAEDLQKKEA